MKKKTEKNQEKCETTVTNPPEEVLEQEIKMGNTETETKEVDPVEELKGQIERLLKEKEELIEQVKYSQAELVSYRMRKDEETANLLKYASQDLISELIPLIDNFESAIKLASKSDNPEVAKYLTEFQLMYTSYVDILKKYGVEEINRVGEVFDSKLEQALVAENDPTKPDEVVLEVLQKGYKLKERVIRPASVKINQI
ncbi:MAG: nucleotide exchange factor GrpE [Bacilli bacterium]|nr:nucleotide exchange factor GrpE [Bacilli bacterium]